MAQAYSNPERENDPHALPDVEVFYDDASEADASEGNPIQEPGWYYWFRFPGCLPNGDPFGPFETEAEALADAQSQND